MKVILLDDVDNVGKKNSIVEVKKGYAYNSLFPLKKAIAASKKNLFLLEIKRKKEEKMQAEALTNALQIKEALEKMEFKFELSFHDGKAKGVITSKMVIDEINQKLNQQLNHKKLQLKYITKPGIYVAKLSLFGGNYANVTIVVKEVN